ncbi:MAG: hypothetical protein M3R38_15340 [Actinomycetota bacterium]|nr:hypothetical protein [Actinomycetota bacterium]
MRHSSYVPVADEVLEELWAQDRFAVPLPGEGGAGGYPEGPTAVIPQKPWVHEMTAKYVADLAKWGGYAWAETRVRPGVAKVGRVVPQRPGDIRVASTAPKHSQHASGESSSEVVLKTLQLEDVKEVTLDKATTLRAERPLTGTIRPWPAAGSRLQAMVEGVPLDRTWANLTPLQRRAVCAEFLRSSQKPGYPKLKFLLAPDGAKLENVDILGVEEDGTEILARVTSLKKGSLLAQSKAGKLKKEHQRPGRRIVFFLSFYGPGGPESSDPSLFPPELPSVLLEDGVLFAPVEEVLEWVKAQAVYADKLFSL